MESGEDRPLRALPRIDRAAVIHGASVEGGWIEAVTVDTALAAVSPGQLLRPRARVLDARGRPLQGSLVSLEWTVADTAVARLREDGLVEVRRPGRTVLRAGAAGWREDSLVLESRPVRPRRRETLLHEDWTGGIAGGRWIVFGEPVAEVVRLGGGDRFPAAFLSNGDENYESGVVSRRSFSLEGGLTVEAWGRAPITRHFHQDFDLGLVAALPEEGAPAWRGTGRVAHVMMNAYGYEAPYLRIHWAGRRDSLPAPDGVGEWHHWTLQVTPGGRLELLVDGRIRWRSRWTADPAELPDVHLVVEGRSLGTRILHGPVTVWRGARYGRVAGPAAPPRRTGGGPGGLRGTHHVEPAVISPGEGSRGGPTRTWGLKGTQRIPAGFTW